LSIEDASILASAAIYLSSEDREGTSHIRMAQIKTKTETFELVTDEQIAKYAKTAKEKYPHEKK